MAHLGDLRRAIAAQRGGLAHWLPVFLAIGIGTYFALPVEPDLPALAVLAAAAVIALVISRFLDEDLRPLLGALIVIALGFLAAAIRAHAVAAPVLEYRYYGPIEGRIVAVDRSASGAPRLTLDRVALKGVAPARTPARVRVSLHGEQRWLDPVPGATVAMTGHLGPPGGPVEPGGFDFQRHAWFDRLGAVGYTRTPALVLAPPATGAEQWLNRTRLRLAAAVRARMGGDAGAFAAAIMTGDRSGLSEAVTDDLRAANLSHLLAISGLHMGLLTGFVFAVLRLAMAAVPHALLHWPTRKIAALGALAAGAAYLALAGGNVATERAFIMVAVVFAAVLADRRAITLRAVAIAATIILLTRPEVLAEPGFQMSFAATAALVWAFGSLRGRHWRWPVAAVVAVVVSSLVAGLSTAPVAAAHFNRIARLGLVANLMSVPLMGLVVMPGAVLAALLAPFGLAGLGLAIMRPAIAWILGVAHWVAGIDGAVTLVAKPPAAVLPLMAAGALWALLWRGRLAVRAVGALPFLAGLAIWATVTRPDVLIADTGGLIGVMGAEGRVLSKARGAGFVAENWLENDGNPATQSSAAARGGPGGSGDAVFDVRGLRVVAVTGRGAAERAVDHCKPGVVVVVSVPADLGGPCLYFDSRRLASTGAVAIAVGEKGAAVTTSRDRAGRRLWNTPRARRDGQ